MWQAGWKVNSKYEDWKIKIDFLSWGISRRVFLNFYLVVVSYYSTYAIILIFGFSNNHESSMWNEICDKK